MGGWLAGGIDILRPARALLSYLGQNIDAYAVFFYLCALFLSGGAAAGVNALEFIDNHLLVT